MKDKKKPWQDDAGTNQTEPLERLQQQLGSSLAEMQQRMQVMEQAMVEKLSFQTDMRRMYDQLYEEMEQYKQEFITRNFQQPLIRDLLVLYDNIEKREKEAGSAETAAQLGHVKTDLLSLLARLDVEPYADALEEKPRHFSLKLHKIVGAQPAASEAEHQQVARVVKTGFMWHNKPVRPEHIIIKKWQQP